jgi:hypothetical protein
MILPIHGALRRTGCHFELGLLELASEIHALERMVLYAWSIEGFESHESYLCYY